MAATANQLSARHQPPHPRRPDSFVIFDVDRCPLLRRWERQGIEWARRHPELVGR